MSSTPATAIQRRRALPLASTFLIPALLPALLLGVSAASAQQTASQDQLPPIEVNPPERPEPDPGQARHRPDLDLTPRRASHIFEARPQRCSGARPGGELVLDRRRRCPAIQRHRRHIDRGHNSAGYRAFAGLHRAGNHRTDAGRAADEPVWRRQWRKDQRRHPRFRRVREVQYPAPHQWTQGQ